MPVNPKNREKLVLSTSHVDKHGTVMSKEALESALDFINGDVKPRLGLEHDMTLPPLGRINDAELVQGEDSEYYLIGHREYYEIREAISLKDGSILIKERFIEEKHKFAEVTYEALDQTRISIDRVNFNGFEDSDKFIKELQEETGVEFTSKELMRKSFIPDPEIVIELSKAAAIFFVGQKLLPKLAEKVSDDISEDIAKFYKLTKATVVKASKRLIPKNRPITYLIQINGDINIDLIVVSPKPDDLVSAMTKDKLKPVVEKIESLNLFFGIDKVQFILTPEHEWEFNYALTISGEAIGTEKAFNKRDKMFKELAARMMKETKEELKEGSSEQSTQRP